MSSSRIFNPFNVDTVDGMMIPARSLPSSNYLIQHKREPAYGKFQCLVTDELVDLGFISKHLWHP